MYRGLLLERQYECRPYIWSIIAPVLLAKTAQAHSAPLKAPG